jgi:hypothetical protein
MVLLCCIVGWTGGLDCRRVFGGRVDDAPGLATRHQRSDDRYR